MSLFELIGLDIGYVLIGAIVVILILFILILVLFSKNKKLLKKYDNFMKGTTGENIENVMLERLSEIEKLQKESQEVQEQIKKIKETLLNTYQKLGIVKYDAFKDMGGKLSFVLVLLNDKNDGFLINSMHSGREGCYTYVKEIIKGEAFVLLSEEEKEALTLGLQSKNLT